MQICDMHAPTGALRVGGGAGRGMAHLHAPAAPDRRAEAAARGPSLRGAAAGVRTYGCYVYSCMCMCMSMSISMYVEWAKAAGITILPTWQEYVVCMGDKVDELTKVRRVACRIDTFFHDRDAAPSSCLLCLCRRQVVPRPVRPPPFDNTMPWHPGYIDTSLSDDLTRLSYLRCSRSSTRTSQARSTTTARICPTNLLTNYTLTNVLTHRHKLH
eukprot:scaffold14049_cov44-Phaeocystis_antarctica.AAC.1